MEPHDTYVPGAPDAGRIEDPNQRELKLDDGLPWLVAFWSPAPQSGKSTASLLLQKRWDFTRLSFAAPVRDIAFEAAVGMGEDPDAAHRGIYEGIDKEEPLPVLGKSAVEWLMFVGTKFGREWTNPNVWVNALDAKYLRVTGRVVIDDVRFPNEAAWVRRREGKLIGIRRPGRTVSAARAAAEGHLTFDDMDVVIDNDLDIDTFLGRVREAVFR